MFTNFQNSHRQSQSIRSVKVSTSCAEGCLRILNGNVVSNIRCTLFLLRILLFDCSIYISSHSCTVQLIKKYFLVRLLSNFEHCEGSLTAVRHILSDTQKDKENIYGSVSSSTIGQLIKQLWGDKVRLVKRGSRNQRQNFYLNLKKKSPDNVAVKSASCNSLTFENRCWQLVEDQETKTLFHRFFPWSFKNQRGSIELKIEKVDGEDSNRYHIASRGCVIDITDMIDEDLEKCSLTERVDSIFQILDTSTFCKGVQLKDGEVLNSVIPHQSGLYNDGLIEEKRAFSNKCSLLCSAGKQWCNQCQKSER